MTPCFIATCRLPATTFVRTNDRSAQPACQPHYDAIMLVLGEQAGRELITEETP